MGSSVLPSCPRFSHVSLRRLLPPTLLGAAALVLPPAALAEVSDKLVSLPQIWAVAVVVATLLLLLARYRPWLCVLLLPLPALWFGALLMEVHSPDVGPAILREQGISFVVQVYLAVVLALLAGASGWFWRKRSRRSDQSPA